MTDLVGGVEPERQEWAAGDLARITWSMNVGQLEADVAVRRIDQPWRDNHGFWVTSDAECIADIWVRSVEPLVAVPAGFGERLAQAIEGLRVPGNLPMAQAWDMRERAAALVREQFTQLAGHDRNKT